MKDRQGLRAVLFQAPSELRRELIGEILCDPIPVPAEVQFLFSPDFFCNLGTGQHEWLMRMKYVAEDALYPRRDPSGYVPVWKGAVLADTRKFGGLTAVEALELLGRLGSASPAKQAEAA